MKIGVIYNFGAHKGGGDYVMLNILEALSDAEYDIHLLTSKPERVKEMAKLFGEDARIEGLKIIGCKVPSFLRHPYSIAYIAKKVAKKYEIFLVADDIPKVLSGKVISYVHYPHFARIGLNPSLAAERYKKSLKGKVLWFIHKTLFPNFFYTHHLPDDAIILANSTLTKDHVLRVLKPKFLSVVYPPVASAQIYKLFKESRVSKEDVTVFVGSLTPDKEIDEIIRVARLVKGRLKLKFKIMGFLYDRTYFRKLLAMIKDVGVEDIVQVLPNAGRKAIIDQLIRAKFIIHPMSREQFGISVVEGMATGCIPIVRQGFNGPWVDIIEKGKYGLGFRDINDLTKVLEAAVNNYDEFRFEDIVSRALNFDEEHFKFNFLNAIKLMKTRN